MSDFVSNASDYTDEEYQTLGKNLVAAGNPGTLSGAGVRGTGDDTVAQNRIVNVVKGATSTLSPNTKKELIKSTAENMSAEDKQEIIKSFGVATPTQKVSDKLWTVVVYTFAVVMIVVVVAISAGAFFPKPSNPVASGELLLSIFTAVVGFFGGLFVKNPASDS